MQQLEARALLTVSLSLSANAVNESDALAVRTITLTATNDIPVGVDETVNVSVAGLTATDFSLPVTQITIPAGQASGSVTFTVLNDTVVEAAEIGTISLVNPSAGLSVDPVNGSKDLTIANDPNDTANISIVPVAPATGAEGSIQQFNVILTGAVESPFTVTLSFANSGLDPVTDAEINGTAFDVTFGATDATQTAMRTLTFGGANAATQTVDVRRRIDTVVEGLENYSVALSVTPPATIPAAQVNSNAADDSAAASIAADTVGAANVSIVAVAPASGAEGANQQFDVVLTGTVEAQFTVTLSFTNSTLDAIGDAEITGAEFDVTFGTIDTTQTATRVLNFGGANPATQRIDVRRRQDSRVEGIENYNVVLAVNPPAGILAALLDSNAADNSAAASVANDATDTANVSIVAVAPATGAEGASQQFDVVLTGNVEAPFVVNLAFTNSGLDAVADAEITGADFDVTFGTDDMTLVATKALNFGAANPVSQRIDVRRRQDARVEGVENYNVRLTATPPAAIVLAQVDSNAADNTAAGSIANDAGDTANVSITTAAPANGVEGAAQRFNVVLTGNVEAQFSVNLGFSNSGLDAIADAEIAGSNFDVTFGTADATQTATTTLTFGAANANTKSVDVRRRQDLRVEGIENYSVPVTVTPPSTILAAQVNSNATDDKADASIDNDTTDKVTLNVQNRTNANGNALLETNADANHQFTVTITGTAGIGAGVEGGFVVPYQLLDGDVPTGTVPVNGREKTEGAADVAEVSNATFSATAADYFFDLGELSSLTVQVKGDQIVELEELFTLELQAVTAQAGGLGTNATVLPQVVSSDRDLGEISNDDTLISVEVNTDSATIATVSDFNTPANGEDNGTYSLRDAILLSNAARGNQSIEFVGTTFDPKSKPRITLQDMQLPTIFAPVTISGPRSSQRELNHPDEMLVISGKGRLNETTGRSIGAPGESRILEINVSQASAINLSNIHFEGGGKVAAGGAIQATGPVSLTLTDAMFSLNESSASGGAISASGITGLTIKNSTFFYNKSTNGGAIDIAGSSAAAVNIENSTFYLNEATASAGMLRNNNPSAVIQLNHVTASDNIAQLTGAAIQNSGNTAALNISNSIVALNKLANGERKVGLDKVNAPTEISGPFTQGGTNRIGADPLLSGLVDAGGATYVLVPTNLLQGYSLRSGLSKSLVIDAATTSSSSTDQRGVARSSGSADIGAVEVTAIQSRIIQVSGVSNISGGVTVDWDTNFTADVLQNGHGTPGDTVALEIILTRVNSTGPAEPWNKSGNVIIDTSAVVASESHVIANSNGTLQVRVPLANAVDIATLGSSTRDPRTTFSLQNLVPGEYRLTMFGLNSDNLRSGGSFANGIEPKFVVAANTTSVSSFLSARVQAKTDTTAATASVLDVELGLAREIPAWFNWAGLSEKWLMGKDKQSYALLPDGTLIKWDAAAWKSSGKTSLGETLETLTSDIYTNPDLLINGINNAPVAPKGTAADFLVWLDQSFQFLPNRTSRFDGKRLSDRTLYGDGEKWLLSASNEWYYIHPDGGLFHWDYQSGLNGTLIAQLPQSAYQNPQLLVNAAGISRDFQYGLTLRGNTDFNNHLGKGERWVLGTQNVNTEGVAVPQQQWFVITSDGNVRLWNGSKRLASSVIVANVGSAVYQGRVNANDDQLKYLYDQDQFFSEWRELLGG